MEITTASQTEAASYRYTPYGAVTITRGGSVQSSDPLGQHWGFTARFHDAETGTTHIRARTLAPSSGRFFQRDPEGVRDAASLYQYALHRPTRVKDPSGRTVFICYRDLIDSPIGSHAYVKVEGPGSTHYIGRFGDAPDDGVLDDKAANEGGKTPTCVPVTCSRDCKKKNKSGVPCCNCGWSAEDCVIQMAHNCHTKFSGEFTCGDYAKELLDKCCCDSDAVPVLSRGSQIPLLGAVIGGSSGCAVGSAVGSSIGGSVGGIIGGVIGGLSVANSGKASGRGTQQRPN
jgi:RHS repeat-associated protein